MALGKLFKSLLGMPESSGQKVAETLVYKGLTIEAAPLNEDGKYRTA